MKHALDQYYIRGVAQNISFLNALVSHPRFHEGRLTTNFIVEEYPDGFSAADVARDDPGLDIAVAVFVHRSYMDRAAKLDGQLPNRARTVGDDFVVQVGAESHSVSVVSVAGGYEVTLDGDVFRIISDWKLGEPLIHAVVNSRAVCFQLDRTGVTYRLFHGGAQTEATVLTPRAAELSRHMIEKVAPDLSKFLLSPMPGLLMRLVVTAGDTVKAGEELAVVEAMKMENSLRATEDVVIAKVLVQQGESLAVDQPILEFE